MPKNLTNLVNSMIKKKDVGHIGILEQFTLTIIYTFFCIVWSPDIYIR